MKMLILIVKDHLTEAITGTLTAAKVKVTSIASTGGFLHSGKTTLLIGLDDAQLDTVIALIRSKVPAAPDGPQATLFVVPVTRFEQV